MIIAIDFDGTCVTHDFPKVGKDIGAVPVLKDLVAAGHQLILWTMRSDPDIIPELQAAFPDQGIADGYLTDAVNWFKENDIPLYGIQKTPTQHRWTCSPKCYAELYIDDAALGAPLDFDLDLSQRPFIEWAEVRIMLTDKGLLE